MAPGVLLLPYGSALVVGDLAKARDGPVELLRRCVARRRLAQPRPDVLVEGPADGVVLRLVACRPTDGQVNLVELDDARVAGVRRARLASGSDAGPPGGWVREGVEEEADVDGHHED